MTKREKEIRELKIGMRSLGYLILSGEITKEQREEIDEIMKKIEKLNQEREGR